MIPQGHAGESPQDNVVVGVVPGVPYRHILEQTTVRPKYVVHMGPHLLAVLENAPLPAIPSPQNLTRDEVFCHVLESLRCHC